MDRRLTTSKNVSNLINMRFYKDNFFPVCTQSASSIKQKKVTLVNFLMVSKKSNLVISNCHKLSCSCINAVSSRNTSLALFFVYQNDSISHIENQRIEVEKRILHSLIHNFSVIEPIIAWGVPGSLIHTITIKLFEQKDYEEKEQ